MCLKSAGVIYRVKDDWSRESFDKNIKNVSFAKMTLSKEVPINNYLPIPILFQLGDPFLILKMCMTNKDAFNYVIENGSIIENIIFDVVHTTVYADEVERLLYEIISDTREKDLNYKLLFLKHLLDYQVFKETKTVPIDPWLIMGGFSEDRVLIQDWFVLFFGSVKRVEFFFEFVGMFDQRSWIYETYGGDPFTPGAVCYALALEYNFRDVRKYMKTILSKRCRRTGVKLYKVNFDTEIFDIYNRAF